MNEQGTSEWLAERIGMITASRIADMMARTKTGESASRANYRAQLVAERMTKQPAESFSNAAMVWGTETEPLARAAYEILTGADVDQVGFIRHPHIERSGASPDGTIGDKGLIEIKCANTATHIQYLLDGKPPTKYIPQMAWQLTVTGREWCDFVSFDPRMDEPDRIFIVRYTPEPEYLKTLQDEVIQFDIEVEQLIQQIIEKRK